MSNSSRGAPFDDDGDRKSVMTAMNNLLSKSQSVSTFMNDDGLPSLPLPSLEKTIERYLESCYPLLTPDEMSVTKNIAQDFLKNEGTDLQKKLQERVNSHRNWLEDWWLHHAYLTFRSPLIPYLNTGGPQTLHLGSWPPSKKDAIKYAALFTFATLCFYKALREELIKPQSSKKGQKFSMDQFRRLFNTCRIPGKGSDTLFTCWKTSAEGACPQHLVVLCHGHIWTLHPWDDRGEPLSLPELELQLHHIRTRSDDMGCGPGIAALTSGNRDDWAEHRLMLQSLSSSNARALHAVESAAFVMVLDDSEPENMSQASWEALCGDTCNRWADKSLTGIVSRTGYVTSNTDHTPYDAMVVVVVIYYMSKLLGLLDVPAMRRVAPRPHLPLPTLLHFDLNSTLRAAIPAARDSSKTINDGVLVHFEQFKGFGKDWMKQSRVHPDAFVQMALQLAYYRTNGCLAPTYETATIRQFYHGRTETMRSCTTDAKRFVEAMQDTGASPSSRAAALRRACATHDRKMRESQAFEGVDRHLMGLALTALESGSALPDLFTDSAFAKTGGGGNYVLSTSTIGYTDTIGGVAPMVPHGYGCFYSMLPDCVYLFVTSYRDGGTLPAEEFSGVVCGCLQDMRTLLDAHLDAKL